ncbi:MAG: Uma2 family endonuclease, partial [Jaaginema sp. PMC 1079.18]|nr:Uma2 family endonuclease [Jaaginema sp. PMC 1079.18]
MEAVTRKRFSREDYHRLGDLGFFAPHERVELIRGDIVNQARKSPQHCFYTHQLLEFLVFRLHRRACLRVHEPIILSTNSEPEPDIVIVRLREDDYLESHPQPQDIILVIEISDSTLE